jgi:hypothetical protein
MAYLSQRKVAQPFHWLKHSTLDLVRSCFAGIGSAGIIIFSSQHIDRTEPRVDFFDSTTSVPTAEVEFEITYIITTVSQFSKQIRLWCDRPSYLKRCHTPVSYTATKFDVYSTPAMLESTFHRLAQDQAERCLIRRSRILVARKVSVRSLRKVWTHEYPAPEP